MDIDYYIQSMLANMDTANKTDAVMINYICMGAIGYAYLRAEIDIEKFTRLNELASQRCVERLKFSN